MIRTPLLPFLIAVIPSVLCAAPEGGNVVAGQAAISKPTALTTSVLQSSQSAIINWKDFSIDVNELVKFLQPNADAVALNRVTGVDPSSILGELIANGRVFLVNPNGILFGPHSKVDVGSLIATTFSLEEGDFLAGKYNFTQKPGAKPTFVVNQGQIKVAKNGAAFLVASGVKNEGLIIAHLGTVVLGSGGKLKVDFRGDGLITYSVEGKVLESVIPEGLIYSYYALLIEDTSSPILLGQGRFEHSPVISFRWLKSPGEIYGRSPVMKALPDIKTANKVVELILKNASIAVTGIWQADDDGVLNPANIELTPGSIIPKAVGSKGLQPLSMPGSFDISQLVLDGLQSRIRHALLADRLAPVAGPTMTATEVLERSAEMALLLGATYGRLQSELLTPLIKRAFAILKRRGEIPDVALDGRLVVVDYRSPLARTQGQRNVQNTMSWISSVIAMGPEAQGAINLPAAARFLGDALGVPSDLIRKEDPIVQVARTLEPLVEEGKLA